MLSADRFLRAAFPSGALWLLCFKLLWLGHRWVFRVLWCSAEASLLPWDPDCTVLTCAGAGGQAGPLCIQCRWGAGWSLWGKGTICPLAQRQVPTALWGCSGLCLLLGLGLDVAALAPAE